MSLANRFLWVIAALILLVVAVAFAWRLAGDRMMRAALKPTTGFADIAAPEVPDYRHDSSWVSRPGIGGGVAAGDPALWTPRDYTAAPHPAAAVFFVPPTAFFNKSRWNAPLDDTETNDRLASFTRMQATVFNGVASLWVPRYRQATAGAFFAPGPDADQALALAYGDVERAFDAFLAENPAGPLILAGHSQGSRHLLHLLKARRADVGDRLVAVYAGGWPVVLPQDTDAIGLPACAEAGQTGCVLSWQSYAADGELDRALTAMAQVPDLSGRPMGADAVMACTNPLTGGRSTADASANNGSLFGGALEPRRVGARCGERGLLLIAPAPSDIGPFVMPGGNYHVYDYALFWANLRADAEARLSAFGAGHGQEVARDALEDASDGTSDSPAHG